MALVQTEPNPRAGAKLKLEFTSVPFAEIPKAKEVNVMVALALYTKLNILGIFALLILQVYN